MRNKITKAITKHSAFHAKRTPKQKQKQKNGKLLPREKLFPFVIFKNYFE